MPGRSFGGWEVSLLVWVSSPAVVPATGVPDGLICVPAGVGVEDDFLRLSAVAAGARLEGRFDCLVQGPGC